MLISVDSCSVRTLTTGAGVNKSLNHNLQSSSGYQHSILHHNATVPACVHGIIQFAKHASNGMHKGELQRAAADELMFAYDRHYCSRVKTQ